MHDLAEPAVAARVDQGAGPVAKTVASRLAVRVMFLPAAGEVLDARVQASSGLYRAGYEARHQPERVT